MNVYNDRVGTRGVVHNIYVSIYFCFENPKKNVLIRMMNYSLMNMVLRNIFTDAI